MSGKILIIGNFGYANSKIDGQTIKTRNLYCLIKEKHVNPVDYFDTSSKLLNLSRLIRFFSCFFSSSHIIYLPGQKSLTFLFPYIFILCKISRKSLTYVVIGGWLPDFIGDKKFLRFALKKINNILLETPPMKYKMESWYNFKNVRVLPNFRIHNYSPRIKRELGPLRCVFMSRIVREKGIDVIFRFVEYLIDSGRESLISVDFFGPIDNKDKLYFLENIGRFPNLKYNGVLEQQEIHKTLNNYDILLLPTRYTGEGFPGAILDAYISGIPVLVSEWNDISSFVEHNITGFIFELKEEAVFGEILINLSNQKDRLNDLKINAYNKSREYSSEKCWTIIQTCLNN